MKEQRQRWAEHFRDLLNSPAPETMTEIRPAAHHFARDCFIPSINKIIKAIKLLKNGKSSGPEALKADPQTTARILLPLITKIWETEELPQDLKEGYIIKLPRKRDLRKCKNYRVIMLLSVPRKILNRIILDRIKTAVDKNLRDQQAGFRRERSCIDQITRLRMIPGYM